MLHLWPKNIQANKNADVYNAYLGNLIVSGEMVEFRRECWIRKHMRQIWCGSLSTRRLFIQFDCTIGYSFWFCASKRSVKEGCDVNTLSHFLTIHHACFLFVLGLLNHQHSTYWKPIGQSFLPLLGQCWSPYECKPYNNTYSFLYQRFLFPIMGMRGCKDVCTLGLAHDFFQYICNCLNWSMNLW